MEPNTKGAATFYQYKLIKKVNLTKPLLNIYIVLPLIIAILESLFLSRWSIFYLIIAAPVVFWVQYVISRSVLLISGHTISKRWSVSFRLPWLGFMPEQYISYRIFRKVQLHNFYIGLCISALFIFWSPPAFTVSLITSHLWLLLPRLYILFKMHLHNKEGMLKFNATDASYYSQ